MINQQLQASMHPRVGDVLIIMYTRSSLSYPRGITGSNIFLLICLKFDLRHHEKSDVDVIDEKEKKNCVLNN
jgi:hypothetical protein